MFGIHPLAPPAQGPSPHDLVDPSSLLPAHSTPPASLKPQPFYLNVNLLSLPCLKKKKKSLNGFLPFSKLNPRMTTRPLASAQGSSCICLSLCPASSWSTPSWPQGLALLCPLCQEWALGLHPGITPALPAERGGPASSLPGRDQRSDTVPERPS